MRKAVCIRYGECVANKCCKECDLFDSCSTSCGVVPDRECKGMQYSINGIVVTKEEFDRAEDGNGPMIERMLAWDEVTQILDDKKVPRIGDVVYRICPAVTQNGKKVGSCKDCPWESCECPDFIKVWDSGSGCKSTDLRVGKVGVNYRNLVEIWEYWFVYYFATEDDAKAALEEYSQYDDMKGTKRSDMYKKYYYDARKRPNPLRNEVSYESN